MTNDDKNELNKIEEIKKKIFSKTYETKIHDRKDFTILKNEDIKNSWDHDKDEKKENTFKNKIIFKKLFFISLFVFLMSLFYLIFNFYFKDNGFSNDNIDISIIGNTFTNGGEEMPLLIEINNKNDVNLEFADLIIEYPKGANLHGELNTERFRESLGKINSNELRTQKINLTLFGVKDSVYEIKVSLEYSVEGSSAIFIKEKPYKITINSTPINFLVDGPSEITPNQELTFKIKTILNNTKSTSDLLVKVDYPLGFEFISADPSPILNNNVWDLSSLLPGEEKDIIVTGKMKDVYDGEEKVFYVYTGNQKEEDKSEINVVFNSFPYNVLIKKPFIETKLFVNGDYQNEYSINNKTGFNGTIYYSNNLDNAVTDFTIKAKFSGNIFNPRGISSDTGFYDSLENTMIWDKNTFPEFSLIEGKRQGAINFSILPIYISTNSFSDLITEPSLNIEISVFAKHNEALSNFEKLENIEKKVVKLISDVSLLNKVEHSTSLPIIDIGPYPPKVEEETTYTITWTLGNTFNNVSKVKVSSTLEPRVNFKNIIFPDNEDLTYNSVTKEIVWNVGKLPRGTGLNTKNKEVSFQVSYTPSLSEVGNNISIIRNTILTGYDDFAKSNIKLNQQSLKIQSRIVE